MRSASHALSLLFLAISFAYAPAAEQPKESPSPFGQAGNAKPAPAQSDALEFAGVSVLGKKTLINLYDKQDKRGFWVEVGTTSSGVTVVKYDSAHDQVIVRRNGIEKTLPLRAASAVVNAPVTPVAVPVAQASTPTGPTTPALPAVPLTTQQRQEEEARMLVSDLLEIGMVQRKAYEDAQRRAANGQSATPPLSTQPGATAPGTQTTASTTPPAQSAPPTTPTAGGY